MAEDFFNGLNIVPLPPGDHWLQRAAAGTVEHPFRHLLRVRANPPTAATRPPESVRPPVSYQQQTLLRSPANGQSKMTVTTRTQFGSTAKDYTGGEIEVHETVRLQDVEVFRMKTSETAKRAFGTNGNDMDRQMADRVARLKIGSAPSSRPVIYRYADIVKNSFALLEAIHFELFLPDRPDLRFLAVPIAMIPNCAEGDYFHVSQTGILRQREFGVKLGREVSDMTSKEYPVVWEALDALKMTFKGDKKQHALAYIMKKKQNTPGGEMALSILSPTSFLIRSSLFEDPDDRHGDSLVRLSMRYTAAAHIYPVEPPIPSPPDRGGRGGGGGGGRGAGDDHRNGDGHQEQDSYLSRVRDVRTSAQRESRVVCAVRALTDAEAAKIEDRLGPFHGYNKPGDVELMDEMFRLGCRLREIDANVKGDAAADAGEMRIDESVILKSLVDDGAGTLNGARMLLDAVYGRGTQAVPEEPQAGAALPRAGALRLNAAQARAVHFYTMDAAPRVFCILSPPGSGKTTVAAAMAAAVARNVRDAPVSFLRRKPAGGGDVQLLLSVQNVAVDNMGAALKKMEYGGGLVYNMKSTSKLDPYCPAPFDFLDLAGEDSLKGWRTLRGPMDREKKTRSAKYQKEKKVYEETLTTARREYEKNLTPKLILSTVEMVLTKMFTQSRLCEALGRVTRVIIDEASLLTEAALFCLMRRFPEAQMVLIGDEQQLPPFLYDPYMLGSELAGRPALTVAMKTGKVPVVRLNEVYRAPPSLVAPYNRLAYDNKLVSRMAEGESPLSVMGLVHSSLPQLLLVDVDGKQEREERSQSLYNEKELKAFQKLMTKFPPGWKDEIMVICLYKEQKKRLQAVLDKDFTVLTVDSAQGKEKPIVILLTTRTQQPKEGHFFNSKNRCNVAVSRQQKALIVMGYAPLLTTYQPWSTVVNGDDFTRIRAEAIK